MTIHDSKTEFTPPYKYGRETKAKHTERTKFPHKLWELLKPGDEITTVLKHCSSSGMYRAIDLYLFSCDESGPTRSWLSYWAAHAGIGDKWDDRREAIGVSGVGMDMGFSLVYELGSMLYPNGFDCIGEKSRCPANDHFNDRGERDFSPVRHHADGGYALRQRRL